MFKLGKFCVWFFFIFDVVIFLLIYNIDLERYFYNSEIENNLSI